MTVEYDVRFGPLLLLKSDSFVNLLQKPEDSKRLSDSDVVFE